MSFGIAAIIPTFSEDVVAIYEQGEKGQDDVQLFEEASIIQATIDEHVTFYRHPLENGRTIIDHRILQPVTIEFRLILTDSVSLLRVATGGDLQLRAKDIYQDIREAFINGTLLSIQTRTHTYRNQIIQSMPHEETSRMFDGIALQFNTSELQTEENIDANPIDETDDSTLSRGQINALAVTAAVAGTLLTGVGGLLF